MSKTELQEKRGRLVTQAREALEEIKKNTDEARTKELDARHDTIMAELDALDTTIAREERVAAAEAREEEQRAKMRPKPGDGEGRGAEDGDKIEYREVFRKIVSGVSPGELSAEERAVLKSGHDSDAEFRVQTAGTTTQGGYTVPVTLANFIIKSMVAWGPMYDPGICTEILTTSGEQINIPTIDDTAVTVVRHLAAGEGVALVDDGSKDVVVGTKRLDAYIFDTEFVRWSIELSQDSIHNWEQLLGDLLGERLARRANTELTTGDGSGDPNGIVTASTLGVTAASATGLTADELIDLQHSVDPAYRTSPKARFMFNDSTLKVLRKLKDGEGRYIWDAGDFTKGVAGSLLGASYSVNQAMASVATGNKSVLWGDFSKYFVRKVGAPIIGVMRERFWPDLGIAGLIRLDGELGDTAAVKHLIQA
jgi:HK97 family phage major capsid protein